MSDTPPTRQQLYDRIRASSKDEVILEEMIRLGFWPAAQQKPELPEQIIRRQGELERELRELLQTQQIIQNPERALKQLRRQRLQAAREQRLETKARHQRERHAKAVAWQQRQQHDIVYLGAEVSGGLNQRAGDHERLARYDLPQLNDATALAQAMGISIAELRFLSFDRKTSRVSHYQRFTIAKKTGGERMISAPMPRLKRAQYWLLDNILNKVPVHNAAHGFLPGRSIVSNARLHSGQDIVINLDIKDFFPTIHYQRVKGLFRSLGYAEQIAIILGLLCTEAATDEVGLDGSTFFVARGQRHLPQGAPTSPMLANLLCRRLDARLTGAAVQLGFHYSRYADDMSFSGSGPATPATQKLLWRIKQIVSAEGFVLHPDKLRIMRSNRRQEVTGLTVNQQPAIERKTLRRFRAVLQQIEKHGPEHKFWGTSDDVLAAVHGFAQYVRMVDRAKGDVLLARVKDLHKRFDYQLPHRHCGPLSRAAFRRHAAAGNAPRTDWWQPRITELPAPAIPAPTVSIAPLPPPPLTSAKRRFSWWRLLLKIIIIMVLGQLLLRILGRLL